MSLCIKNPPQCVYIQSLNNERRYKLLLRGDTCLLGTEMIKQYIEKLIGVPVAQQKLTFNGRELEDGSSADSIGLYNNAVLHLQHTDLPVCDLSTDPPNQRPASPEENASPEDRASRSPITPLHSSSSLKTITTRGLPRRSPPGSEGVAEYQLLQRREWEAKPGAYLDPYFEGHKASKKTRGSTHAGRSFMKSLLPTQFTTDRTPFHSASSHFRRDNATETMHDESTTEISPEVLGSMGERNGNPSLCEASEDAPSLLEGSRSIQRQSLPGKTESIGRFLTSSKAPDVYRGQRGTLSRRAASQKHSLLLTDRYLPALKAENQALTRENELLQEKLLEAERRAANATSDWKLQEEVLALKEALETAEKEKQKAVDEAQAIWQHKEAELIAELDLLRKELMQTRALREDLQDERQGRITSLQSQMQTQKNEIRAREETIRQLHFTLAELQSKQDPREVSPFLEKSLDELVQGLLERMSRVLDAPQIKLDDKGTCAINISDEMNIFVTLDSESERLHVYTMLLNELPDSEVVRLRLYENLLEGALLGRSTAGGTISISKEEGIVLLSISVDVRYSDEGALAHLVCPFLELVRRWQIDIQRLLSMP